MGQAGVDERWLRPRTYPHFDNQPSKKTLLPFAESPDLVATHSFWPFILRVKKTPRFKAAPDAKRRRDTKERPICYAAHIDAHIYALYASRLSVRYEAVLLQRGLRDVSLAYRKLGQSNIDFAGDAFEAIRKLAPCEAIALDVSQYFDRIDHALLKRKWASVLGGRSLPDDHYALFKNLTKFSYVKYEDLARFHRRYNRRASHSKALCTTKEFRAEVRGKGLVHRNRDPYGIPQGSPISAVLSNMFLTDFDESMNALARTVGGIYKRYCDDILWIVPDGLGAAVENATIEGLGANKLTVNPAKVDRSRFTNVAGRVTCDSPLQYLGFAFDGEGILVRGSTLSKFYRRMRYATRATVRDARRSGDLDNLRKRSLYKRYTHLGTRNFYSYASKAAEKLNDEAPKRQLSRHWIHLQNYLDAFVEDADAD